MLVVSGSTQYVDPLAPELESNKPEYLKIILGFVAELSDRVTAIEEAYENEDWHTIREVAHKLRISDMFGYPALSEVAKELGTHSKSEDADNAEETIAELAMLCARIEAGAESIAESLAGITEPEDPAPQ